jgi:GNAT superfamily N-acetyltransferase
LEYWQGKNPRVGLASQLSREADNMLHDHVKVSSAEPQGIDTVLGILDEAARWLQENGIPGLWKPGSFSRQGFLDHISRGEVYIGWVDGDPVGTLTLQWSDPVFWGDRPPDSGYLHKLAIRPAYHGKGIGLDMLRWAEAKTKTMGKRFLRLDCAAEDRKIREYYEKEGFVYRGDIVEPRGRASLYEKTLR